MSWDDVNRTSGSTKKNTYTKFGEGNTVIRIIDNEPYSFWSHWMQKHNNGVSCLGKDCPICSVIAQQKANKEVPTYSSTQRHAVRIWNYTTNQMEVMIQGKTFFQQLLTLHKEVGDITTYDIKVVRKGSDTNTTYTLLPQKESVFAHKDELEDIDFAESLKAPERDKLLLLMEGKTWEEVFGKAEEE